MQNRNYSAEGTTRYEQRGRSSRSTQHLIDHLTLLLQLGSATSAATITKKHRNSHQEKNTHQDTNQTSGQSVQATNVNINATDDMFLAFSMVQQIMTELSGTATEKKRLLS
jgi:hypothetical protein